MPYPFVRRIRSFLGAAKRAISKIQMEGYQTMALGLIGRKIGMTSRFDEKGNAVPVTVVQLGPCEVIQKKTLATDSYSALQLGFEEKKEALVNKPEAGHFAKSKLKAKKHLKEIRLSEDEVSKYNTGDILTVELFEKCKFIDVVGTTKGRGYTGVVKRHGFQTPRQTHGTHDAFRHGGSLGMRFPQHVAKGKKMAGHYGNERVTTQNLEVVAVRKEENLILIKGSVPGPNNGIVMVKTALRKK